MGNFASSALCSRDDSIDTLSVLRPVEIKASAPQEVSMTKTPGRVTRFLCNTVLSLKTTISGVYGDAIESLSGSSAVLSELEEAWFQELVGEIDAVCARCAHCGHVPPQPDNMQFLGPNDITVAPVGAWKSWAKTSNDNDDDSASCTTEETDDESKYDFSDCEAEMENNSDSESDDEDDSTSRAQDIEYYAEDDATETKADRLIRLSSLNEPRSAPVYVDDYLCPCGECPQYARIACDVHTTVTWRSVKEKSSIIRVLQAFSTYNEVIGYQSDMIEAAEECLQVWLGDEDRALTSLVMLYDEVPQLCASEL